MASPRTPAEPGAASAARRRDAATGRLLPNDPPLTPSVFEEQAELSPPGSIPNRRIGLGRVAQPPGDPGGVREMYDGEQLGDAELELRQERARHLMAIEDNPFIGMEDQSSFPQIPEDDPNWAYMWIRHYLPPNATERGEVDVRNMNEKFNGRLRYEPVRIDQMPEEWQKRMGFYRGKVEGIDGTGQIVFRDLILCRTSRLLRDQKQAANDYFARQQRLQVHQKVADASHREGFLARKAIDERRDGYVGEDAFEEVDPLA